MAHRPPAGFLLLSLTAFLAASAAGQGPARRERGLGRFAAPDACIAVAPGSMAIPECLRAPAMDAPSTPMRPTGVLLDDDRISACFDPDFPPSYELQLAVARAMGEGAHPWDRYDLQSSWPGADNGPITLTWSFVPDGLSLPGGTGIGDPPGPSELFANLDARFGGDRALWIAQFEAMFTRWSQLSGVRYTRVTSGGQPWDDGATWGTGGSAGARGDIRIGMHPIDGAFGVIAYNGYPSSTAAGDMVLDSAENWGNPNNSYRFLRNTISHEHGHGLGMAHVCPRNNTKLMEPFLSTAFDGPQQDEIRAVQRMYGDPYEPNGGSSQFTPLGILTAGGTLSPSAIPAPAVADAALTSIAINDEIDKFSIVVGPEPLLITATVTPVGSFYADYAQDSACNTTDPITNAANVANLALELTSEFNVSLRTASSATFGQSETIAGFLGSPNTTYIIKVFESNNPLESQLYSLSVSGALQPFAASDGTFPDRVRLTWTSIPTATAYTIFRGTTSSRASASQLITLGSAAVLFDDVAATSGVNYFYWLEATISGISGSRPAAGPETGFRGAIPGNDACASAAALTIGVPLAFNSALAGTDGPVESACGQGAGWNVAADLWFTFTAPSAGRYAVSTCGSSFDTRLAAYAACPGGSNSALACDDNAAPCAAGASLLRVAAAAGGQSFRFRVGSAAAPGGAGSVRVYCRGDFNLSGDISVQDIFDLLAAYFALDLNADVNASGDVTVQDIFDFLALYFGACG